jgi:hypothetical protein
MGIILAAGAGLGGTNTWLPKLLFESTVRYCRYKRFADAGRRPDRDATRAFPYELVMFLNQLVA